MVAAAIEESITMAEEEERKRRDQQAGDGGPQELVDGKGVESTAQSAEQGDGAAAAAQGDSLKAEQDETEEQGDNPNDPPAPRRSGRKPLPAGTSLAVTYRNTRSSPSPTPSVSSEDELDPYVPILADLDMAKKIFAERAGLHWRDALAAGGGATVQGPGVNPAFAGQVMMGGTGGMMREGEVVAEFLYSTRVKSEFPGVWWGSSDSTDWKSIIITFKANPSRSLLTTCMRVIIYLQGRVRLLEGHSARSHVCLCIGDQL